MAMRLYPHAAPPQDDQRQPHLPAAIELLGLIEGAEAQSILGEFTCVIARRQAVLPTPRCSRPCDGCRTLLPSAAHPDRRLIAQAFLWLTRSAPRIRRALWRRLFEILPARFPATWWTFMNYGYHDPDVTALPLSQADWDNRYSVYLYHRVVDGVDLVGRDVLEIGCGRGGGAAFLSRYWRPRWLIGIDISRRAIEFCKRVHRNDGLAFIAGDAEAVPCRAASFDAIVNVESSFCYGSMDRFLGEVRRLLRPGGHFLFADIRLRQEMPDLRASVARSGLELVCEADISANVAAALQLDGPRRRAGSRDALPWPAQRWLDTFAGIEGTRIPEGLASGKMVYVCCKLRKPDPAAWDGRRRAEATLHADNPTITAASEPSLPRHAGQNQAVTDPRSGGDERRPIG